MPARSACSSTANANARAADDPSTEDAPFAGSGNKSPAPFAASPSAGFAAMGQWVLSMRTTGDGGFVFFHKPSGGDWTLSLHPSIDYFITSSVSLGATFGYSLLAGGDGDDGGRPRRARRLQSQHQRQHRLLAVGRRRRQRQQQQPQHEHVRRRSAIFAPFLYHLVPHLFVGVGPSFSVQLTDGNGKQYGLDFVLGGWL